jgi:hypothetical protein
MYFTRAQAEEVARLFAQQHLMGLLGGRESPEPEDDSSVDVYH